MIFDYDEDSDITDIDFSINDVCYDCGRSEVCPLVACLQNNLVYPNSSELPLKYCELKI